MKSFEKLNILLRHDRLIFSLFLILPIIIVSNSNLDFFCSSMNERFIPLTNDQTFVVSLCIFIAFNCIILPLIISGRKLMKYGRVFNFSVFVTQCIIVSLVISLFLQMVFFSYYAIDIISVLVYLASSMSIGILIISFIKLYSWFKLKKQPLILLYSAIMILLIILTLISSLYISQNLQLNSTSTITDSIFYKSCSIMLSGNRPTNPYNISLSFGSEINLSLLYNFSLIASYLLTWLTSVLILREYARRIGKVKYIILVTIPLLFFAFRYIDSLTDMLDYLKLSTSFPIVLSWLENLQYTPFGIFVDYSLLFGSLFFALVFLGIYSKIPKQEKLRTYVLATAVGMFLVFSSRELVGLFLLSYPPLGVITISFIGVSSYLFFYGIFQTASIISRNIELKNKIFAKIGSDTAFLEKISTAENVQIIMRMVRTATNRTNDLPPETNDTLNDNELRLLVQDIIHEIKEKKEDRNN